jgi:UDP-N-acetylglucosamine 2-epimerase (non-hydrolysing)
MAPVVRAFRARADVVCEVIVTGQHRALLDQMLATFGLSVDADLDTMRAGQSQAALVARMLEGLEARFAAHRPDLVLVQGDTTTAFVGALAAFYAQIPVGHVEAGLRTGDRYCPFPEELHRSMIARLATLHFAPHENQRRHLLREGVPEKYLAVTGNTVIDALHWILDTRPCAQTPALAALLANGLRTVLLTTHRRESFGAAMRGALAAIARVVSAREDTQLLFPVHLNPSVRGAAREVLGDTPRVHLLAPLDYAEFVCAMASCTVIASDSGGVQEEAPALGKPLLVLREQTERPEVIDAGCAELVGTNSARIESSLARLLDDPSAYDAMSHAATPYGSGGAAARIAECCMTYLGPGGAMP